MFLFSNYLNAQEQFVSGPNVTLTVDVRFSQGNTHLIFIKAAYCGKKNTITLPVQPFKVTFSMVWEAQNFGFQQQLNEGFLGPEMTLKRNFFFSLVSLLYMNKLLAHRDKVPSYMPSELSVDS